MIELFVEGRQVDVNAGFSTLLTMAIDDIKDFGAKNTTFSKTIVLPGTKTNNAIFGNIFEVTAANEFVPPPAQRNVGYNFNAAIGAQAYIFADNLQIFKGIIRIMEIVIEDGFIEYETVVFGELGGFIAKMGNHKLEELDFSAYDHTYSYANITASWSTAAAGTGYYYPLIDYGTYSTNKKDWNYKTFRPALYVAEYIDKIMEAAGYTIDCALMATSRFKGLGVPHNTKDLRVVTSNLVLAERTSSYTIISWTGANPAMFAFQTFSGLGFSTNAGKDKITYTDANAISVDINILLYGQFYNDNNYITIEVLKNGSPLTTFSNDILYDTSIGGYYVPWYLTYGVTVPLITGDYIEIRFFKASGLGQYEVTADYGSLTISTPAPILAPISLGGTVVMNDVIPKNILQKDFFSSIIKLFNLYVFEDYEKDNTLKVVPFIDFYLDADADDWSNKIDRSKPIKIKPMSELNSRYFEFNFKDDSDYYNDLYKKRYNEAYGSRKYDSGYEFAQEVKKVELIFSGTPLVGYAGEDKIYSTIFKRSGTTEESIDSNIRIMQFKNITGVAAWDMKDGATVLGSPTSYGYAGHLDDPDAPANDIQFGVPKELFFTLVTGALNINQFNVYWSPYLAEITDKDSRLVTCTARLAKKDVFQLDFSRLIWMDGNLYRLNSIEDFNASNEDVCKISLLKIINRIY